MDIEKTKNEVLKIDVEKVLYSKNPGLRKVVPKFIVNYLKRIVHQDDLNYFLENCGHLKDAELIEAGLKFFGIKAQVSGTENIPRKEGIFLFPIILLGGLTDWSSFMNYQRFILISNSLSMIFLQILKIFQAFFSL